MVIFVLGERVRGSGSSTQQPAAAAQSKGMTWRACYGTLKVAKEREKGYVGGNFTQFQAENKACNCIHSV